MKEADRRDATYSLLALVSLIAVSCILFPFSFAFQSSWLLILWFLVGAISIITASKRASILAILVLFTAISLSGQIAYFDSPNWVFNWIIINLTLIVFLLLFIHSLAFRDNFKAVRDSVLKRETKVSAVLAKLDERPLERPSQKRPIRAFEKSVKIILEVSVEKLKGWLGLVTPEERELIDKERMKNYIEELKKAEPNLMEYLKLTAKAERIKSQQAVNIIALHYLITEAIFAFIFLTPVWILSFRVPPEALETIDIFQPEIIMLAFLLYCILILIFFEARLILKRLVKRKRGFFGRYRHLSVGSNPTPCTFISKMPGDVRG